MNKSLLLLLSFLTGYSITLSFGHPTYSPPTKKKNAEHSTPSSTTHAQLQAVDKVTGTFSQIVAPLGKSFYFNDLKIQLHHCAKPGPFSQPEHKAFLKIDQPSKNTPPYETVFSGWMFSSSPAANTLENHPRYNIWLSKCVNLKRKQKTTNSKAHS